MKKVARAQYQELSNVTNHIMFLNGWLLKGFSDQSIARASCSRTYIVKIAARSYIVVLGSCVCLKQIVG